MIDLAYPSLTQDGYGTYVVGRVSDEPGNGYLWHYWLPWLALLDREHLRLCRLDTVLKDGRPFVFPLEFRWECIKWMKTLDGSAKFLTPHIPPAVLDAARRGNAIILLFFGHEGRLLSIPNKGNHEISAYDLIFDFVCRSQLPRGAVWFINGNLAGEPEYRSWKSRRLGGEDRPDAFLLRCVEPFSHLAQATRRERERGLEARVGWEATKNVNGTFTHLGTRLALEPAQNIGAIGAHHERPTSVPRMLFLCMNRMPRKHRRAIVCHLLRLGFLERSLVSFNDENTDRMHFSDEELEAASQELQRRQPLIIDRDLPLDFKSYYRTNGTVVNPGEVWPYRDTCFSIVTETQFNNEVLFVSEKIWKPIQNCHPFLVVGTPGTLSYIRRLGFRTFEPLIDESYDSLIDDEERMQALFGCIETLGNLDEDQRADLLNRAEPILLHNERCFRQLRSPMARLLSEIDAKLNRFG